MAESRKLKDEIKRDLIEYFDSIRSQVDVRAQILLYEFETNKLESTSNFNQKIIKYINKCMIDKIYQKLDESIDNINDYFIKHVNILDTDKDQIKLKALKNDCVYFRYDEIVKIHHSPHRLRFDRLDRHKMGFLLCFDWYLDENLINFIE